MTGHTALTEAIFRTRLRLCDNVDHALPYLLVRKPADAGLHVVFQMTNITRSRDRAGYGWMRDDPFQKELRPVMTIEFRGPLRQRLLTQPREKVAATKGAIDDDGHTAISSEWQDLVLGFTLKKGVIDLDKIDLLRAKERRDFTVRTGSIVGDAEVTRARLLFPVA